MAWEWGEWGEKKERKAVKGENIAKILVSISLR